MPGAMKPPARHASASRRPIVGAAGGTADEQAEEPPPSAPAPLSARNVVGVSVRPMPAASSRAEIDSSDTRGLRRSTIRASEAEPGVSTRSLKRRRSRPVAATLVAAVVRGPADGALALAGRVRDDLADEVDGGGEEQGGKYEQHRYQPLKETILRRKRVPSEIITTPRINSLWPVDVWKSGVHVLRVHQRDRARA